MTTEDKISNLIEENKIFMDGQIKGIRNIQMQLAF